MKKLVLVMVFVLLTAVFIGFNYLLWEREGRERELKNLEYANASNNASISEKIREIDSLEKEITSLGNKITQLEYEKEQLIKDKSDLVLQKSDLDTELKNKIDFINIIKQYTDIDTLSEPLKKWADALNQGKYGDAYELEYASVPAARRTVSLAAYSEEMRKTIKKLELNEVKIDKVKGSDEGDIVLDAKITVKLAESADKNGARFSDGVNVKYVKIDYSPEKKAFVISSISSY